MMFFSFSSSKPEVRTTTPVKNDRDVIMKILLIGDSAVGKTCLLLRFTDGSFNPSFIGTVGIDFRMKELKHENYNLKLQIWDTAGQDRFRTITTAYYRNAMGILLVYDITNENSFHNVINWMKNIQEFAPETVSTVLVGNKNDIVAGRVIPTERGEALAKEFGIPFLETSARTKAGVDEAFMTLSQQIFSRLYANHISQSTLPPPPDPIVITDPVVPQYRCCSYS